MLACLLINLLKFHQNHFGMTNKFSKKERLRRLFLTLALISSSNMVRSYAIHGVLAPGCSCWMLSMAANMSIKLVGLATEVAEGVDWIWKKNKKTLIFNPLTAFDEYTRLPATQVFLQKTNILVIQIWNKKNKILKRVYSSFAKIVCNIFYMQEVFLPKFLVFDSKMYVIWED